VRGVVSDVDADAAAAQQVGGRDRFASHPETETPA
jgi:hypothetical protein